MKPAVKAALLSALIFPGSGQIYLRRRARGLALIAVTLGCLALIITATVSGAMDTIRQMQDAGAPLDVGSIEKYASKNSADYFYYRPALYILMACWIFALIDAWIIGKRFDSIPQK